MKKCFIISVSMLILYMGIIFWFSSLPSEQLIPESALGLAISSSVKHVIVYAILGLQMSLVIVQVSNKTFQTFFYAFTLASCYGVLDEIHQSFVPSRYCTFFDVVSNIGGSIIGVFVWFLMYKSNAKSDG